MLEKNKKIRAALCLYFTALLIILFAASIIYERSTTPITQSLLGNFSRLKNSSAPPTKCTPPDLDNAAPNTTTSGLIPLPNSPVPIIKPESQCLSRKESPSYIRRSPYKPSSYLLSKLRDYEELHRRCGPYSAAYNRTVTVLNEKVNASSTYVSTECSYVVYGPVYGLGNRIVTLASTFLYALLTGRVLLVKFGSDMSGLFCEPFPYSSWILPSDFPGMGEDGFESQETFQSMMGRYNNNQMRSNKSNGSPAADSTAANTSIILPPFLYVNLQSDPTRTNISLFPCDEVHQLMKKIPVLTVVSDVYFIPSLFMIPSFTEELGKMFRQKEAVFHHLSRFLFHPSDEAWELIKNFYDVNMAKADEKIGLQIRVFNKDLASQEAVVTDHILSCTQGHNILPNVDNYSTLLEENANSSSSQKIREVDSYKSVLVTSLYPNYAMTLRKLYGRSRPTAYGEVIEIHQASNEWQQLSDNSRHNLQAWVEMYLLSLCDKLVTSSSSTFGYVAQGLGGLKPWVLLGDEYQSTNHPVCKRAATIDPCFHAPPRFDCKAGVLVDSLINVFSFIKVCEDRPYDGIRLSDYHIDR